MLYSVQLAFCVKNSNNLITYFNPFLRYIIYWLKIFHYLTGAFVISVNIKYSQRCLPRLRSHTRHAISFSVESAGIIDVSDQITLLASTTYNRARSFTLQSFCYLPLCMRGTVNLILPVSIFNQLLRRTSVCFCLFLAGITQRRWTSSWPPGNAIENVTHCNLEYIRT